MDLLFRISVCRWKNQPIFDYCNLKSFAFCGCSNLGWCVVFECLAFRYGVNKLPHFLIRFPLKGVGIPNVETIQRAKNIEFSICCLLIHVRQIKNQANPAELFEDRKSIY